MDELIKIQGLINFMFFQSVNNDVLINIMASYPQKKKKSYLILSLKKINIITYMHGSMKNW